MVLCRAVNVVNKGGCRFNAVLDGYCLRHFGLCVSKSEKVLVRRVFDRTLNEAKK